MEVDAEIRSTRGKEQLVRGRIHHGEGGLHDVVTPVGGHGSHLLGDLAVANALIAVPPEVEHVSVGDRVDVIPLDQDF